MKKIITIVLAMVAAMVIAAENASATKTNAKSLFSRKGVFRNRRQTQAPVTKAPSPQTSAQAPVTGATSPQTSAQVPVTGAPSPQTSTDFAPVRAPESATATGEAPALNWDAVAIDLVLQAYGEQVDKTILKDPTVPNATITLKSRQGQKLTKSEYLEAIEAILEMNGVHLEPYGERFIRALPRKDVRKEGIPLIMNTDEKLNESTRVVSMMIPFRNISTEEAQKVLEGLKSNAGQLLVFERTNSILVTDTEQNINRMLEIVRTVDISTPVSEQVFVRQIKNASAEEIKSALEAIVADSQKEQDKNGKVPNQSQQQQRPQFNSPLLRRGQQPQQPQPVNNASLVMSVSDADRGMIRGKVMILSDERSNKLVIITSKSNMDFFDKVIEELDVETTPDIVVKVYRLKYADSEDVSDMINDLIGNSSSSKGSSKNNQNQNAKKGTGGNLTRGNAGRNTQAKKPANQRTGEPKAGELSKDNTTVLSDKRINGLVVMTNKELVPTIESIIESMDIKLSQVLIETMIIEVTLGDDISTGMDWVQHNRNDAMVNMKDATGQNLAYTKRTWTKYNSSGEETGSGTSILSDLVPEGYSESGTKTQSDGSYIKYTDEASDYLGQAVGTSADGVLNYYTAGTATAIGGGQGGSLAHNIAAGVSSNIFGKALNFVFSSDELGITAILQATKTDSRTKYVASPIIMTLDNKEAVIEATAKRQFLTGWQATSSGVYSGSGMPSPSYSSEDIGIKIKATPKINPNGTVMLEVEEEYSQIGGTQTMKTPSGSGYIDTTVDIPSTRKMSSDVILENNQTVVFGGLTQVFTSETETGVPFLKDIPYIGKWLFGTVTKSDSRTELLVFMTPYVLDDSQSAQAEALRRKKTMSDSRAWEDNGWSLSNLADPVSKKEQLRRLKEEAKKQDEERSTKLAIEQWKIDRAKKLKEMSKEEREHWLNLHKEELEKEKQEELEKKMLDKDSQEELKKLAEEIKAKKLKEAEKEQKEADELTEADNERTRLEKEKKAKAKAKEERK